MAYGLRCSLFAATASSPRASLSAWPARCFAPTSPTLFGRLSTFDIACRVRRLLNGTLYRNYAIVLHGTELPCGPPNRSHCHNSMPTETRDFLIVSPYFPPSGNPLAHQVRTLVSYLLSAGNAVDRKSTRLNSSHLGI